EDLDLLALAVLVDDGLEDDHALHVRGAGGLGVLRLDTARHDRSLDVAADAQRSCQRGRRRGRRSDRRFLAARPFAFGARAGAADFAAELAAEDAAFLAADLTSDRAADFTADDAALHAARDSADHATGLAAFLRRGRRLARARVFS